MNRGDDPLGKRALFGPPPTPDAAERVVDSGRRALFSGSAPGPRSAASSGPQLSQVRVECRSCGGMTAMGLTSLAVQLVPSIWLPLRRWSRLMRCPSCRHLTWCHLSWPA